MLTPNPYDPITWQSAHRVSAKVSPADYAYLKRMFPMQKGLHDIVVSHLYKAVCDALHAHEKTFGPLESAWETEHSTYDVLNKLLSQLNFNKTGKPTPPPELDYVSP